MNELKEVIAKNLIFLRKKHNLTQLELAEKINYSDKAISRWERGEVTPSIETFKLLGNFYNLNLETLLDPDLPKYNKKERISLNTTKALTLLFSISIVWCILVIVFIYLKMFMQINAWILFVAGVPTSCLVSLLFNKEWGTPLSQIILSSIISWSTLACVYLFFLDLNLWLIFLLGVPIQSALITSLLLKKQKNKSHKR